MAAESPGPDMRRYLRARHAGVLSTISAKLSGYPFGSVVPFILDHEARPVILVSSLAEHSRNMAADARVSLIAQDTNITDVQAGARLTCVADAEQVPQQRLAAIQQRYLRFMPKSRQLLELGDFRFWRLSPKALRYIGGFGRIQWIAAEAYAPPQNDLESAEQDIVDHMNTDHAQDLADYCRHYLRLSAGVASMVGLDCDGIDIDVDGVLRRIAFEDPVHNAEQARAALAGMARTCRGE